MHAAPKRGGCGVQEPLCRALRTQARLPTPPALGELVEGEALLALESASSGALCETAEPSSSQQGGSKGGRAGAGQRAKRAQPGRAAKAAGGGGGGGSSSSLISKAEGASEAARKEVEEVGLAVGQQATRIFRLSKEGAEFLLHGAPDGQVRRDGISLGHTWFWERGFGAAY